ncbi:MAG TPA: hypothetical protein VMF67_08415 [Rhizomicrobium sp.]|nr:hypothetical protein [Rhizomicrobium sp.]
MRTLVSVANDYERMADSVETASARLELANGALSAPQTIQGAGFAFDKWRFA